MRKFVDAMARKREVAQVAMPGGSVVLDIAGKARNERNSDTDLRCHRATIRTGILPLNCFKKSSQMYRMFAPDKESWLSV
jgi:hypothetical protein